MNKQVSYNEFGAEMIENRPTMATLDLDTLSRNERKEYLSIIDNVARTAYAYIADKTHDNFPAFRASLHALFTFVGCETRILALDGYTMRFVPATCIVKVKKSNEYKSAEKAIRIFKDAISWAKDVSLITTDDPNAPIFPGIKSVADAQNEFYSKDYEDEFNAIIRIFSSNDCNITLQTLTDWMSSLERERDYLKTQDWHYYCDYQNPMMKTNGKFYDHAPEAIRRNIENTMADLLTQRALMTEAQLSKEEAQIKGGRKAK